MTEDPDDCDLDRVLLGSTVRSDLGFDGTKGRGHAEA
jgi:hypothetical protein